MKHKHQQPTQQRPAAPTDILPTVVAVGLGHMKSGQHAALVLEVRGDDVLSRTLVAVSPEVAECERPLAATAWRRVFAGQAFTAPEQAANARDSKGFKPEEVDFCSVLTLQSRGRQHAAILLEVEGQKVVGREVLAKSDKMTAWGELERYINLHLLNSARRLKAAGGGK